LGKKADGKDNTMSIKGNKNLNPLKAIQVLDGMLNGSSATVPQIDNDWKTIYPKDSVVEINEGGTTNFVIHADNREYQIKIRTDTLLRIIKKKAQVQEDENFIQCGEYYEEKSNFVEIGEDDLYG
jgi:hypothetical protein